MKSLVLVVLLLPNVSIAGPSPSVGPPEERLRSLVATSGAGVERVLDGNDTAGWQPPGRPTNEGITFSFEVPRKIGKITATACGPNMPIDAVFYCDGTYATQSLTKNAVESSCDERSVKTVFLQLRNTPTNAGTCVGEVRFFEGDTRLQVLPPRMLSAEIDASSTLAPPEAFHSSFLVDGRLDFGWAEGAQGSGEKENVSFRFATPQTLTAIEIWNGYQRSPDHFAKNARAKTISINVDGATETLALEDKTGAQKITFAKALSGKVVKLTIDAVYPGKKYPDLVISELRFFDANGPLLPATTYREEHQKVFLATHTKTAAAAAIDTQLRTLCGAVTGELKLRSNASFVAFYEEEEQLGAMDRNTTKRIVEGAWVPNASSTEDGVLGFDLYAKQYVARAKTRQYGRDSKRESVGIIGGKHKIYDFAKMSDASYDALLETWKKAGDKAALACTVQRKRADFAKDKIVFIGGPVFNDFFNTDQ